jgi:flagellar basal body-associated protein FliL
MLNNNKKLMAVLIVPILLIGGYTMTKHKPAVKQKVAGTIYVMPQSFLLNLSQGRFAKLSVALLLAPGQSDGAAAGPSSSGSESTTGTLPEEPLVREIVTNAVTGQSGEALVSAQGRSAIKRQILGSIRRQTDVKVQAVLIPDFTVQ